ncbi:TPA: FtsX-like permease family protein, partial [Candidatus Poribacteria bacterium]|nr:FtsX-like permease family protein [Candidatus Poribacteria bacterium]
MSYIIEETFSNLKSGGVVNLISCLTIALATIILSLLMLALEYIGGEVRSFKDRPVVVAFLSDSLDESSIGRLKSQVEKMEGVKSVEYVSKEKALERCKGVFGDQWKLIVEGLEDINPLPASLEITVKEGWLEPERLAELAGKVEGLDGVEDVRRETDVGILVRRIEAALWGTGAVLGIASAAIVFFSVMLTAHFRREEIRIMRLVGATNWFVRAPLMLQGVFLGPFGGIIGQLAFYGIFKLYAPQIGISKFLPPDRIVLLIILGIGFGLLGGIAPIRRYV